MTGMEAITTKVQITERQQVALALFLLNQVKPANRDERRRYKRTFVEFKIMGLKDQFVSSKFDPSKVSDKAQLVDLSGDPVDYALDKLNTQTDGVAAFPLLELEEILLVVKDGKYVLPVAQLTSVPPEA